MPLKYPFPICYLKFLPRLRSERYCCYVYHVQETVEPTLTSFLDAVHLRSTFFSKSQFIELYCCVFSRATPCSSSRMKVDLWNAYRIDFDLPVKILSHTNINKDFYKKRVHGHTWPVRATTLWHSFHCNFDKGVWIDCLPPHIFTIIQLP